MDKRLDLHNKLVEILESKNVYYQPPENTKIEYTAIKYSLGKIESRYANNIKYSNLNRYDVTVIGRLPNDKIVQKLLELPYSSFDRHYVYNNLNHDVIILYY